MNWRAYFRLVRWRFVLFDLFAMLPGTLSVGLVTPAVRQAGLGWNMIQTMGEAFLHVTTRTAGAQVFALVALLVPGAVGFVLRNTFRTPLQWWFTLLLPGARLNLLRCHAVVIGLIALGCAAIGRLLDPATPLPAFAGISVAILSLLQVVPPQRRRVFTELSQLALAIPLAWFASEIRSEAQAFPLITFFAGVVVAGLALRLAFSRGLLRKNATERFVMFRDGLGYSAAAQAAAVNEFWRTRKTQGNAWQHRRVGDSAFAWLRVSLHECYGANSRLRLSLLGVVLVAYALGFVIGTALLIAHEGAGLKMGTAAQIFYLICDPAKVGNGDLNLMMAAIIPTLLGLELSLLGTLGRGANPLYVISRAKLARVAYLSSLLHLILLLMVVAGAALVTAWIASLVGGIPFFSPTWKGNLMLVILGSLPAMPLVQSSALVRQLRGPALWVSLAIVGGAGGGVLGYFVSAQPAVFFSWRWLPLFGLAVVAGQFAFYSLVRRSFLRRDLIGAGRAAG